MKPVVVGEAAAGTAGAAAAAAEAEAGTAAAAVDAAVTANDLCKATQKTRPKRAGGVRFADDAAQPQPAETTDAAVAADLEAAAAEPPQLEQVGTAAAEPARKKRRAGGVRFADADADTPSGPVTSTGSTDMADMPADTSMAGLAGQGDTSAEQEGAGKGLAGTSAVAGGGATGKASTEVADMPADTSTEGGGAGQGAGGAEPVTDIVGHSMNLQHMSDGPTDPRLAWRAAQTTHTTHTTHSDAQGGTAQAAAVTVPTPAATAAAGTDADAATAAGTAAVAAGGGGGGGGWNSKAVAPSGILKHTSDPIPRAYTPSDPHTSIVPAVHQARMASGAAQGLGGSGLGVGMGSHHGPVCPHKVIVFSQFWMHLQLIAQELTRHGIAFVNYASNGKTREC